MYKNFLELLSKPFIYPATRLILSKFYNSNRDLSEIGDYKNILVLAPHIDDETIGAGGVLKKHSLKKCTVNCIVMTDGAKSNSKLNEKDLVSLRKEEMKEVKETLGFEELHYLNLPDGEFRVDSNSKKKLKNVIEFLKPELIYCPPFVDAHVDHISTVQLLSTCLKELKYSCIVRLYEINCAIPAKEINCIIDITETFKYKKKAINHFNSQRIAFNGFLELNKVKSKLINKKCTKYVETFIELNSKDFIETSDNLAYEKEQFSLLFKQINKRTTLLWAVFKNYNRKKNIYKRILNNQR